MNQFTQTNPDPRELKRALAVQMVLKRFKHRQIQEHLAVSSGFISKWTNKYRQSSVKSLQREYIGSVGYLDSQQRQEIIEWLEKNILPSTRNAWCELVFFRFGEAVSHKP